MTYFNRCETIPSGVVFWEENMLDGTNFDDVRRHSDNLGAPPIAAQDRGDSERCDWCQRETVTRCGGFCQVPDQAISCDHAEEVFQHLGGD